VEGWGRRAIGGTILACAAVGVVLALVLMGEDWPLWRRIAGGLVGGAATGFVITATKMF